MGQPEADVKRRALSAVDDQDESRLAQFGYKQELRRDWGLAHNFGVSFSIIVRYNPSAGSDGQADAGHRASSRASRHSFRTA